MLSRLLIPIIVGCILNIVLPLFLKPFATEVEKKPPGGPTSLSLKGQFMHMMVHHNQVPLMSTVIIAIIVGLSVQLCIINKNVLLLTLYICITPVVDPQSILSYHV